MTEVAAISRGAVESWPSMEDFSAAENALHAAIERVRKSKTDYARQALEREYYALDPLIQRGLLNYPQVYGHFLNATADKPAHRAEVEKFLPPPFVPPAIIDVARFREAEAPPRKWLVEGWIPANDCTLIGADGGTGKTTIGTQLNHAMETQGLWLGMEVAAGPSLYVTAEEPRDEMHFRYRAVAASSCNLPVHRFDIISLAEYENTALIELVDGKPRATELLHWIEARAAEIRAKLIVLDAIADVCAINEVDRQQVRRSVAIFRAMAIRLNCAIVLMAHPSVDGIKSGRGYSGSTHWNNAVRSRMYFTTPASDEGEEIDQDARILSLEKANRAKKGQKLHLRWDAGRFVLDETNVLESRTAIVKAKETFIALLKGLQKQGRGKGVGINSKAPNYAPRLFERLPDAHGIKAKIFEKAMEELFSESILQLTGEGPPSKRREYITISNEIYV